MSIKRSIQLLWTIYYRYIQFVVRLLPDFVPIHTPPLWGSCLDSSVMLSCFRVLWVMRWLSWLVLWAFYKICVVWMITLMLPTVGIDKKWLLFPLGNEYRDRKSALHYCMRSAEDWTRDHRPISERFSVKQNGRSQLLWANNSLYAVQVR